MLNLLRISPVDAILTRMGAYDNMFSNASTFKVELDEWLVIINEELVMVTDSLLAAKFYVKQLRSLLLFLMVGPISLFPSTSGG